MRTAIAGNTFVPGAIADNLTSYGAAISTSRATRTAPTCPASESQTSIARFIRAGATGAHGTVNEPLNNVFPNAGTMLHYTFGYSMGESYFFNQRFLYWQNIHLGDPLATPYGKRPDGDVRRRRTHPVNGPPITVTPPTPTASPASISTRPASAWRHGDERHALVRARPRPWARRSICSRSPSPTTRR